MASSCKLPHADGGRDDHVGLLRNMRERAPDRQVSGYENSVSSRSLTYGEGVRQPRRTSRHLVGADALGARV